MGGCTRVQLEPPTPPHEELVRLEVDKTEAAVGEPVTFDFELLFQNPGYSGVERWNLSSAELGACLVFKQSELQEEAQLEGTPVGLCPDGSYPLQSWLRLPAGVTVSETFGGFTLTQATQRSLKHNFIFTATKPGEVVLRGGYVTVASSTTTPEHRIRFVFEDQVSVSFK